MGANNLLYKTVPAYVPLSKSDLDVIDSLEQILALPKEIQAEAKAYIILYQLNRVIGLYKDNDLRKSRVEDAYATMARAERAIDLKTKVNVDKKKLNLTYNNKSIVDPVDKRAIAKVFTVSRKILRRLQILFIDHSRNLAVQNGYKESAQEILQLLELYLAIAPSITIDNTYYKPLQDYYNLLKINENTNTKAKLNQSAYIEMTRDYFFFMSNLFNSKLPGEY